MQNLDPQSSVGAALLAISRFNTDASVVSDALAVHLRSGAGGPEVRGFLVRMHLLLGEFSRAAVMACPRSIHTRAFAGRVYLAST